MYIALGESWFFQTLEFSIKIKDRKLSFTCGALYSGYHHTPRLASLLGACAKTGAYSLLVASSAGGASRTGAPPGALLTGSVISLLSLADDCGVLFGFNSTKSRLASVCAHSWYYWRYLRAPLIGGTSHPDALFSALDRRCLGHWRSSTAFLLADRNCRPSSSGR